MKAKGRREKTHRQSVAKAIARSDAPSQARPTGFAIAGIGASAGGLEAFTELLAHLPAASGMGFVLIQHLDPQHRSALAEILAKATKLPVREAADDLRVAPDHIYVIPPNANLAIANGVLKLHPRPHSARQRAIDFFLESLANDKKGQAIGVILSGTATDGTLGLEAIKAEGGITFAQDDSARYDSMPRSAIAAGCVDFVLDPKAIAHELARIAKHPFVAGEAAGLLAATEDERASEVEHEDDRTPLPPGGHETPRAGARQARAEAEASSGQPADADRGFKKILLLLRNHCGVDFSLYKSSTIQRRIARRMVLNKLTTPEQYAAFLRGNAKELDALYSDMLISVTSFFRNPEAFDTLTRSVFPKLLRQRNDDPVRVWVLGCSTGQEAYSIAMAFTDAADKSPRARQLQVFATDLNDALLDKARRGLYDKSLASDVSPERLRKFFVEEDGGYRINKSLRENVVFARQNLISDPPFSRMDLVSCRNLMIYLEPELQKKLIPTLHYALRPGGFLFLGASESVGGFTDLFEPLDKKYRIYSRKDAPTPVVHLPLRKEHGERAPPGHQHHQAGRGRPAGRAPAESDFFPGELNSQREADRITVNKYAPPGVLVDEKLHVLQFRGPTSRYLEPPTGKASFDVLKMAREGLMLPMRAAINAAKKQNKPARRENVRVKQDGAARTVNVDVIPLKNLRERCFLILFEDAQRTPAAPAAAPFTAGKTPPRRIAELERELSEARDYLQSVQEQFEAGNEELQASNEEVQSANEELQSLNEELETSKEELESANEELTTLNEELTNRNGELGRLNSDLVNFQTSTRLPILLLGRDLTIRRFSLQAEKLFNLVAADVGRPIGAIRHNLDLQDIGAFAGGVISDVRESEREVRDRDGRWYSLRARPYLTLDNTVDGAVLVLVDIDMLKRSEQTIAAARDYAANTVDTVREPLVVLDEKLRVESANRSFYSTFQVSAGETVGRRIFELGNGQWNIPRLRMLLEQVLPQQNALANFEVEQDFQQLGHRTMLLNAKRLLDPQRNTQRILLAIEDTTDAKRYRQEVESARDFAEAIIGMVRDPLVVLDAELRVETASTAFYRTFKTSPPEIQGRVFYELSSGQWNLPQLRKLLEDVIPRNSFFDNFEVTQDFEGIGMRTMLLNARRLSGVGVAPGRILLGIQDVTELLHFQAAARQSQARYQALVEASAEIFWTTDASGRVVEQSPSWQAFTGQTYEQSRGFGWLDALHPDDRDSAQSAWSRAVAAHSPLGIEYRMRHTGGDWRWMAVRAAPVFNPDGSVREWVGMNIDTTARKAAERRQQFLAGELVHRGKNLLSVVQAIVSRSLSGTMPIEEEREVLVQRIQALARSQTVLVNTEFQGAPVADIVHLEFEAFSDRVEAVGPKVMLNAKAAQTFALVVHELATNATKYGALSRPEGQIAIRWSIEGAGAEAAFRFRWQERGGPRVNFPSRQGFGSVLLETVAAQDFGVQPEIRYAAEGLSYEIDAPAKLLVATS